MHYRNPIMISAFACLVCCLVYALHFVCGNGFFRRKWCEEFFGTIQMHCGAIANNSIWYTNNLDATIEMKKIWHSSAAFRLIHQFSNSNESQSVKTFSTALSDEESFVTICARVNRLILCILTTALLWKKKKICTRIAQQQRWTKPQKKHTHKYHTQKLYI